MNQHAPPPPSPRNDPPSPAAQLNQRFVMIVGVLLLMIIALLAGLWLRERVRAARAEVRAAQAQEELRLRAKWTAQRALESLIESRGGGLHVVSTQELTINGKKTEAFKISPDLANEIGFGPGDVIIVEQPPPTTTTAPATRPRS